MTQVKCEHKWRYRKGGYIEGCVPAICKLCGKHGCACDAQRDGMPWIQFFDKEDRTNKDNE